LLSPSRNEKTNKYLSQLNQIGMPPIIQPMQTSKGIQIRAFTMADYAAAVGLWSTIEGLHLNESDTPEAVAALLERNPGFSAVAIDGEKIIGAVLCGHNGRAGQLYHLAVAKSHRGRGIGQALVNYCFGKLSEVKIPRCNIFVYSDNNQGNSFWLRNGWLDPSNWKVMQKLVGS
jgi:putative acetyltransferase